MSQAMIKDRTPMTPRKTPRKKKSYLRKNPIPARPKSKKKSARSVVKVSSAQGAAKSLQHPAMYSHAKSGVVMNWKSGKDAQDQTVSMIVGHHAAPFYKVRLVIFAALARKCFDAWGFKVNDWNETPSSVYRTPAPSGANPETITSMHFAAQLIWRYGSQHTGTGSAADTSPAGAGNPNTRILTVPYQGEKYMLYAYKLMNKYYSTVAADLASTTQFARGQTEYEPQLVSLFALWRTKVDEASGFTAGGIQQSREFNLLEADVTIDSNATLKIQNRSKTMAGDNEADDIDLVPLIGKAYTGKGPGMIFNIVRANPESVTTNVAFPALYTDGNQGFFYSGVGAADVTAGNINSFRSAPLPKKMLKRVNEVDDVSLDPGQIHNSLLKYSVTKKLNYVMKLIYPWYAPTYDIGGGSTTTDPVNATTGVADTWRELSAASKAHKNGDNAFGEYRAYWLEKQLNFATPSTTNTMQLAIEIDTRMGCSIAIKKKKIASVWQFREWG